MPKRSLPKSTPYDHQDRFTRDQDPPQDEPRWENKSDPVFKSAFKGVYPPLESSVKTRQY